jgi:hypothetical protein
MNTIILVFMLVNGQPTGSTMQFLTVGNDCRTEIAVIDGINQVYAESGIERRWYAVCERKTRA